MMTCSKAIDCVGAGPECEPAALGQSMQPKGQLCVVLTAFGSFEGVPSNPTEQLLAALQQSMPHQTMLLHQSVLTVAAVDADMWVQSTLQECIKQGNGTRSMQQPEHILVLHLGVATSATKIRLEHCAYNLADFRIPDMRGVQLATVCIDDQEPLRHCCRTSIDVVAVANALNAEHRAVVELSIDPGAYICNWLYYRSLKTIQAAACPAHVLFVHVPPFDILPLQAQLHVLQDLIQVVHAQLNQASTSAIHGAGKQPGRDQQPSVL